MGRCSLTRIAPISITQASTGLPTAGAPPALAAGAHSDSFLPSNVSSNVSRFLYLHGGGSKTAIMGVLNLTPDSFAGHCSSLSLPLFLSPSLPLSPSLALSASLPLRLGLNVPIGAVVSLSQTQQEQHHWSKECSMVKRAQRHGKQPCSPHEQWSKQWSTPNCQRQYPRFTTETLLASCVCWCVCVVLCVWVWVKFVFVRARVSQVCMCAWARARCSCACVCVRSCPCSLRSLGCL